MCEYCETKEPLDSLAEKWLFDEVVDIGIAQLAFGGVIHPAKKRLNINVVTHPVIERELLGKPIEIRFCPMCGREL